MSQQEDAVRKMADWFHDWFFRDAARDELVVTLNALGVGATMAERGRHEEALKRQGDSRGLIDITQGPVKWINVVTRGGGGGSPLEYWYVFGIPSERGFPAAGKGKAEDRRLQAKPVELSSVRRRAFPVFGPVQRVDWKGNDGGRGLISALATAPEVEAFCRRQGDLCVRLHHGAFQGWTVEMKRGRLSHQDWETVDALARFLSVLG